LAEAVIEQMSGGFGGYSLTPGFRLDQVPDLAFFGASEDRHAAEPHEIAWWASPIARLQFAQL